MKISSETINVLKNFASINPGIVVKAGNEIRTVSLTTTIIGKATVAETFPEQFGIYDLNNFLSVISLYGEPELEFGDKQIKIKGNVGRSVTTYRYTEPKMIVTNDLDPKMPSKDLSFKLSKDDLTSFLKTADVLQSPDLQILGDGKKLCLVAFDTNNDAAHTNTFTLGPIDVKIKITFKRENFKMIVEDYDVTLSAKGLAKFANKKAKLEYYVVAEKENGKKEE